MIAALETNVMKREFDLGEVAAWGRVADRPGNLRKEIGYVKDYRD